VLWKCGKCTTLYAVGLDRCPHCGAEDHTEVDSGGNPVAYPEPPAPDVAAPGPEAKPATAAPAPPSARGVKAGG
jgi:hypothetical protein